MSPLLPVFFVVLLGLGAAVHEACRGGSRMTVISLPWVFHVILAGILCLSIIGNLLLEAGVFRVGTLLALASLLAGVAVLVTRRRPTFLVRPRFGRAHILLLIIVLLAIPFRFPPSNWTVGAIDQGVYVNVANHIRQSGTLFIRDDQLLEYADDAATRDYYLRHTYMVTRVTTPSCDEGLYTPGIFVQDLANGLLVPQFYHLHPLWLAISASLFGPMQPTLPLPLFALLSIGLIYRLTSLLVRSQFAALSAALLLAVNPLHSYMSKLPVSEVPTAFFFLAGLYFLVRLLRGEDGDRFNGAMSVLSFACVFLTRITGFLYLPALLAFLAYVLIVVTPRSRRRAIVWTCAGIVAAYAYSALHGYLFSCAYGGYIYRLYLRSDFSTWAARGVVALLAAVLVATYLILNRYRRLLLRGVVWLRPWRSHLSLLLLAGVLVWSARTGYAFVSNEAQYGSELRSIHVDPAVSPKLAGMDMVAIAMLNGTVLSLLLTPLVVGLAIYGMYLMLRRWPSHPAMFLCGALAVYFLALNTIANVYSPYLYYYARYLLSETVPLLLVAAAIALGQLRRRWPRAVVLALLVGATPCLVLSYLHSRDTEMKFFYTDMARIAATLDDDSVVLIDQNIQPDWRRLAAPLKLSFNISTFWYDRDDLMQGRLDPVLRSLAASRRNVFLISNEKTLGSAYFTPSRTLPIRLNSFLAKWLSLPVGFVVEQDTEVTVYRSTERLRALAPPTQESSAWIAQQFE